LSRPWERALNFHFRRNRKGKGQKLKLKGTQGASRLSKKKATMVSVRGKGGTPVLAL